MKIHHETSPLDPLAPLANLKARADSYRLEGPFFTIGAAAALTTNEGTPKGFYEDLAQAAQPDGYLVGAGCGNVISALEAFPDLPLGLVLVDVDPAVIFLGQMLIRGLARHPTAPDFVRAFFCSGRVPLEALEREVLEGEDISGILPYMQEHRSRVWETLSFQTRKFALVPEDAEDLMEKCAEKVDKDGAVVPVLAYLVRNYSKLYRLAVEDRIVILRASLLAPNLHEAIADLPGFSSSTNLIYISNILDHVLRRSMFESAQWKLRLTDQPPRRPVNTTADFLPLLADEVEPLRALAARGKNGWFIFATEETDALLEFGESLPQFTQETFYFQFDLDLLSAVFLSAFPGEASEECWQRAARVLTQARGLWIAAAQGKAEGARQLLAALLEEVRSMGIPPESAAARESLAFSLAESATALWFTTRSSVADGCEEEMAALREALKGPAKVFLKAGEALLAKGGGSAMELAVTTQAALFLAPEEMLGSSSLKGLGASSVRALVTLQREDGFFPEGSREDLRCHAETLMRLVLCHAYLRGSVPEEAVTLGISVLKGALGPQGNIDASPPDLDLEGLLRFRSEDGALYPNASLTLLFVGFVQENFLQVREAILVSTYFRMKSEHRGRRDRASLLFELVGELKEE